MTRAAVQSSRREGISGIRAAVVHDAFVQLGGGERVAAQLSAALGAPLHAAAIRPETIPGELDRRVHTTFVQTLVGRGISLRSVALLLPAAFAGIDVGRVEVVVSSSSAFAHHVRAPRKAVHVCYCHTPPRFLWEPDDYFHGRPLERVLLEPGLAVLRRLDLAASRGVDLYVANSRHVAAKIARVYGRDAIVVHPPVDTTSFRPTTERSGRFLVVSRLRNQKRVDLVVEAANLRRLPLDVIGDGPELARLRGLAGPTVRFLGRLPDEEVRAAMARSEGVVVAAVQDFGLTLVEAQASGRPPIAFGEGGALEVVEDGRTGFLFRDQTPAGVGSAMERARRVALDVGSLVGSARRFDVAVFRDAVLEAIDVAIAARAARVAQRSALSDLSWRPRPSPGPERPEAGRAR